ncbi:MAG: hypothetical protein CVU15_01500 [Betaproteobacteria bacterium HGW-Betaproteobacteria-1]|jgi:hypothetical protein|nr:MAG: hypothetical protein CVU15_01500 [Betaproteobacteria bacterium HGW-Betaproteobacteria-1]
MIVNYKKIISLHFFIAYLLFPTSIFANDMCQKIGEVVKGKWEFDDSRTFSFIAGQPKLILDNKELEISSCLVTRISALFFIDNNMVNIRFNSNRQPENIYINRKFYKVTQHTLSEPTEAPEHINPADHFVAHTSTNYPNLYQIMQREDIAKAFGTIAYKFSPQLKIETRECGTINAFYSPSTKIITLCYEYLDNGDKAIEQTYGDAPIPIKANMKTGILAGVLLHEIGHAVIHLKNVPLLGSEEDAADRFAYVMMYEFSSSDPERLRDMVYGNLAYTWSFRQDILTKILTGHSRYMDEHPITEQRYYNLICLAYGSNSELFGKLRSSSKLSDDRAERCTREFNQVREAVSKISWESE